MTEIIDNQQVAAAAFVTGDNDVGAPSILPYAPGTLYAGAAAPAASLAFVDTSVAGWQGLVDGIEQNAEVVFIPQTDDPLGFIADVLQSRGTVGSVHILSHGGEGFIQIGGHVIDAAALSAQSATLASWGAALGHDADILLYGCDTGEGTAGQNFVNAFAAATGADVAASDDLTGSAARGGDWTLETHSGSIETASLDLSHSSFSGTLNATFDTSNPHTIFGEANTTNSNHPGPGNVVLFDADGDGDLDFIDMQWDGSSPLYLNNGSGVFTAGSSIAYSGRIEGTVAVDIDGDGDKDLVSHLVDGSTKVQIFTNDGHGVFTAGTTLGSNNPTETDTFTVGDIDNDGDMDVVVGIVGGSKVYLNDGSGGFTESATLINNAAENVNGVLGVKLVDLNRDGLLDIVLDADTGSNGGSGPSTTLFRNDGGGHFTAMGNLLGSPYSGGVFVADFNNDGFLDIYQNGDSLTGTPPGPYETHNRIYYNNGTFNLTPSAVDPISPAFRPYDAVDIDGDGDVDFAATSTSGYGQPAPTTTGYYINNGDGTFTLQQQNFPHSAGPNGTDSHEIVVSGDINGDGTPDTVVIAQHYAYDFYTYPYTYTNDYTYDWYANQTAPQNTAPTANADAVSATEAGGTANGTAGVNPSFDVIAGTGETVSTGADTDPDSGDTLTVQGVAAGTTQTALTTGAGSDVAGQYGTIHINSDGTSTYTVDNTNQTVQALASATDTLTDTFSYTVTDSGGLTSTTQVTVTIHGANDAPTLDLDASANGSGFEGTYTEGAAAVAIADTDVAIADVDTGATVASATITLTNHAANDLLSVSGNLPNGITASSYDPVTGVLTLTGTASAADYEAAIQQIVFSNSSDTPSGTDRTITVSVSDGALDSPIATATIHVTPTNDDPVPNDHTLSVAQRTIQLGNVLTDAPAATDPEGDSLSVTGFSFGTETGMPGGSVHGTYGTLTVNSNGTYAYSADVEGVIPVGDTATDTFDYTVSDGHGGTATGHLAVTVTGSATGNSSANTFLLTGTGTTATGLDGNDTYYVDNMNDRTIEAANGGDDTVLTTVSYTLTAGQSIEHLATTDVHGTTALTLTGNALDNEITGNAGANTLSGGGGNDTLIGGDGADRYYVTAGTHVVETPGGGGDIVYADISFTLDANVENIRAYGAGGDAGVSFTGNALDNVIAGGAGVDTLTGLGGNDRYYVTAGDHVVEAANGGTDTVYTTASFALEDNVENLRAYGKDGDAGLTLTGNALNNVIVGGAGADTLVGGGGADRLFGNGGHDVFQFNAVSDSANAYDRIYGFVQSEDKIDLHAIQAVTGAATDQAFDFIGEDAFTGVAGQLHQRTIAGNTFVEGDVNGDGRADFRIFVEGLITLNQNDFNL